MPQPRVYVVLLNWNGYEHTRTALESLRKATYQNLRQVVVDNGSAEDPTEAFKREFPTVEVVRSSANLGFSRGCNLGIRHALLDPACAYVLLLNNDAVPTAGFLEPAIEKAERDSLVGAISGKVIGDASTGKLWYAGGRIDFLRGRAVARGFNEIDNGQYNETVEVGFVTGGLMLIRRVVLETVGLLPEEYFFGQEEWDYSVAVARAGFKLLYVPEFVVYHSGDGSHWNSDPKYVYNSYRQKFIFQKKYLTPFQWRTWFILFDLYCRFFARRVIRPLHLPEADFEGVLFAMRTAIDDHRKEGSRQMCEGDLLKFAQRLAASRSGPLRTGG